MILISLKVWDADFDNLETTFFNSVENFKTDHREADVLFEIVAGALIICLADEINLDVVKGIAALKNELKPEVTRLFFKDSGFKGDVIKTNAVQILRRADIDDVKSP